ncbi:restriction endonuclease subunit S [Microbacterium schleiferi]|uniref:Restriction endonuclease subunit S n=1 Tax=Microbacterium schleiferi TaxID=69362 RepID=A0A7S8RHA8_9MICO|nr:restriction endonuclease subunit S [Microbacterium schleiferi]QPE04161.1 restriction endonuclease subunit S [Microbacterium schleiferi]
MTWETVPFDEAFADVTSASPRIKQSEFAATGLFPVRDQGEEDVAGYWSDESFATRVTRPLILFGDHTRRVKYAEQDFVVGADGVKVLEPAPSLDPRFAFHWMCSVRVPSAGYSRHFKFLKYYRVPLPPLPEQRRIAAILDEADAVRVLAGAQESKLRELLDSFFDSVAGAPGRRSVTVGDLVESSQYGTSAKAGESGQFPILRMGNVTNDGRIDLTNMKFIDIDESDHARYLVHRGDLLFNRTNSADLVGKTAVYREAEPRAFAGYLVRLRPKSLELGEYVAGYLNSRHGKLTLRKMAKSIVGMANINAREALSIRLPEPDSATLTSLLDLRQRVEAERERLGTRRRWTDELFASLQHRAFRGEL